MAACTSTAAPSRLRFKSNPRVICVDPSEFTDVMEDSPEMVLVYKSWLKDSEFHLIPASTTREADDLIDRMHPAVILLDVVLRSESTWEFLARLKRDERTKDVPLPRSGRQRDRAARAERRITLPP